MFHHLWFSHRDRFLKNFLNFSFWIFLLFGFYLLFFVPPDPKNYPHIQGYIALFSAFIFLVPIFLYHWTHLHRRYRTEFVTTWKGLLGIPLILNAVGSQGLFDLLTWYDSFVHFSSSWFFGLFLAFLIFLLFDAYKKRPDPWIMFFVITVLAFFGGLFIELYERYADLWFGTRQWGQLGQDPWDDTVSDLFYDILGSFLAGVTIVKYQWRWFEQLQKKTRVSFSPLKRAVQRTKEKASQSIATFRQRIQT